MNIYALYACACLCVCAKSLESCLTLCGPINTIASPQAPLSLRFSRQEYWSELPCPPLGDLPDPGIEPTSLNVFCFGKRVLCHYCHLGSPFWEVDPIFIPPPPFYRWGNWGSERWNDVPGHRVSGGTWARNRAAWGPMLSPGSVGGECKPDPGSHAGPEFPTDLNTSEDLP